MSETSTEQPIRVGRYTLYRQIAAGGYATVHLGRLAGEGGFSLAVAIKRLHPQFAKDPAIVRMFLDEARIAARVKHPNVVSILDVVADDGELYLVMDFVRGESLAEIMERASGPVPLSIAVALATQMLRGLHAAHEARGEDQKPLSIVHRDVSPQNVLVGEDGSARVADFGIAKAVGRSQTTEEGRLKGKVRYMAAEQVRGELVDRRADVYGASVVIWEMLTGRPLFSGEPAKVLYDVLKATVVAPSTIETRVPQSVDTIVASGLARDRDDRFATALDMAAALEAATPAAAATAVADWIRALPESAKSRKRRLLSDLLAEIEVTEAYGGAAPPDGATTGALAMPADKVPTGAPAPSRRTSGAWLVMLLALGLAVGGIVGFGFAGRGPLKRLGARAPAASSATGCGTCAEGTTCSEGACRGCVERIFAGQASNATCAVRTDGKVFCWGDNAKGLLQRPGPANVSSPVELAQVVGPTEIELTSVQAFAVIDHKLVGWGVNLWGALGPHPDNGEFGRVEFDLPDVEHVSPRANVAAVCAVTAGKVACWGGNLAGQLGRPPSPELATAPVPVPLSIPGPVTGIDQGGTGTVCATGQAGAWSCWGNGSPWIGSLNFSRARPRDPKSPFEANFTVVLPDERKAADAIALSGRGGCRLTDGQVECWGDNAHCQVTSGGAETVIKTPEARSGSSQLAERGAAVLDAGYGHYCAIDTSGAVWCWGQNDYAQSGVPGGRETSSACDPVPIALDRKARALALGVSHTCVLTEDRVVFCFGSNRHGELGQGATGEGEASPRRVPIDCTAP